MGGGKVVGERCGEGAHGQSGKGEELDEHLGGGCEAASWFYE